MKIDLNKLIDRTFNGAVGAAAPLGVAVNFAAVERSMRAIGRVQPRLCVAVSQEVVAAAIHRDVPGSERCVTVHVVPWFFAVAGLDRSSAWVMLFDGDPARCPFCAAARNPLSTLAADEGEGW